MLMPSILGESLFDEFFDEFARPVKNTPRVNNTIPAVMKTDVREYETGYELDIELPGYKKEDVQAQLKDGYLIITATMKRDEQQEEGSKYIRRERYVGSCSRSFYVGDDITQQDIKAKFEDGVLKVLVPKKEAKPKVEESQFITIEG